MILRPSIVFGPEDDFFNRFAGMARFSPALPLIGGGKTYELAGPRVYSFRELMELLLAEIGRKRLLLPIPWGVARLQAAVLGLLPFPPLTTDQVKLLERDNVAGGQLPGFAELGIAPSGPEAILPAYLDRFRLGSRFSRA